MDGVELSADQAAVAAGLWSQARRRREHRQRRERREHLGELVQMDGSFHQWFEDHGPKGCLMALCTDWKAVYAMKPSEQQLLRGEVPETKGRVERNHGTTNVPDQV